MSLGFLAGDECYSGSDRKATLSAGWLLRRKDVLLGPGERHTFVSLS